MSFNLSDGLKLLLTVKQLRDSDAGTSDALKAVVLAAGQPYLNDQIAAWVRQMQRGGFVRTVDDEVIVGFSVALDDDASEVLGSMKAFAERSARALKWVAKHGDRDMPT